MPTDFSALTRVTQLVAGLPGPWGFGGGWGLDLFLGKPTRAHKDVDVAILRRHQLAWQSGLTAGGWTLAVAHHGKLSRWADGQPIELPLHVVWGKNPKHDPDFIELLLNDDEDGQFVFRRESSVRLPLAQAFLPMRDGLVVLAPELILLYKAKSHANDENEHDFESALPALDPFRRAWLTAALGATHPGHPWISRLGRH